MKMYDGMLPAKEKSSRLGYYPVISKQEWDELPDLYKVMQWEPVKDHNNGELRAVKAVIFDVPFMEPYGIRAQVSVHPSAVQKVLFCSYKEKDCHLYSVCAIELEGGTRLAAKWLQDSITGSFAIVSGSQHVGVQGGFRGFVPEGIKRLEDGSFKYDYNFHRSKTTHYELSNPFREEVPQSKVPQTLTEKICSAELRAGESKTIRSMDTINKLSDFSK